MGYYSRFIMGRVIPAQDLFSCCCCCCCCAAGGALCLAFLLPLCSAAAALPLSELSLRSSYTPTNASGSLLLSAPNGSFSFGFTEIQSLFYLAIRYSSLDRRIVWIANNDAPASASACLAFTSDGDWQLHSSVSNSSDVLWNSGTQGMGVRGARLEDSGNLVLVNASGGTMWQSFDHPTDTLMPTQWLKFGGQLICRRKQWTAGSGDFQLKFDDDGNANLWRIDSGVDYFPFVTANSPGSNSLSAQEPLGGVQLDSSGILFFYNNTRQDYNFFYPLDFGNTPDPIRRVTLDVDGNLRTYSWQLSSSSWIVVWEAVGDACSAIPSLCGSFGVCIYRPNPICICPPGFHIADPNDISQGCTPNVPIDQPCSPVNLQFVKLPNTDYPFNDLYYRGLISLKECVTACQNDCSCALAVYDDNGQSKCWLKSAARNGYLKGTTAYSTFLKVSGSDHTVNNSTSQDNATIIQWTTDPSFWSVGGNSSLQSPHSKDSVNEDDRSLLPNSKDCVRKDKAVISTMSVSVLAFAEFICLAIGLWFLRKLRQRAHLAVSGNKMIGSTICFPFKELETATNGFSNKLGEGAFSKVFSGSLSDGRMVAVKRLEGISHGEDQFRAEIVTLGKIHHINLVRLYGFCAEGNYRLLVYELMENGSLDAFLFGHRSETGNAALDWTTRFAICLGVARAIAYLHDECLDYILHCDIKPQNILLDRNLCPKVADFGLSYLFSRNAKLEVSAIRGTRGYLAPEWLANLPITAKADVFSFGVVLMEILSGQQNSLFMHSARTSRIFFFPEWAFQKLLVGEEEEVLDASLRGHADLTEARRVLSVAFLCIHRDQECRPAMRGVVQMLEGSIAIPGLPPVAELFP